MFDPVFRIVTSPAAGLTLLALCLAPQLPGGAVRAATQTDSFAAGIERALDRGHPGKDKNEGALRQWYADNGYEPLWLDPEGFNAKAHDFLDVLLRADREGLNPGDYPVAEIGKYMEMAPAEAELLLSGTFVQYASDLRTGRLSPRKADPALFVQPRGIDRRAVLNAVRDEPKIDRAIETYTPSNPIYRRLRRILAQYRGIEAAGGWPQVPDGASLKPGMQDSRVALIRQRLKATRDLAYVADRSDLYNGELVQAVERFQKRHGLEADGIVGRHTLAEMNIPVQRRIEQIVVNMERWRWMPDDLGDRYILVNLAAFELDVVEYGSVAMHMRVVAGKPYRRTPVFSGSMTYLEFNPTWTVPPTIVKHDILPRVRKDPDYLAKQNIRVFAGWQDDSPELASTAIDWNAVNRNHVPYRFRQDPGPDNALGRVKFMFPNRFDVYLHDTPARALFNKTVRSFSSGCVRVEDAMGLAEYLTAGLPGWTRERIDAVVASNRTTVVKLDRPVPVYLTYSTVWFGEGGTINFRDDVYARDDLLLQALFGYPPARKQIPQDR
jgi:murein L,D-transpeptidase YcbB/YkuD